MRKKPNNIFEDLDKLARLKTERPRGGEGKVCPIYSPPQMCVSSKCLWYDLSDMSCWVLNPKPKRVEG